MLLKLQLQAVSVCVLHRSRSCSHLQLVWHRNSTQCPAALCHCPPIQRTAFVHGEWHNAVSESPEALSSLQCCRSTGWARGHRTPWQLIRHTSSTREFDTNLDANRKGPDRHVVQSLQGSFPATPCSATQQILSSILAICDI